MKMLVIYFLCLYVAKNIHTYFSNPFYASSSQYMSHIGPLKSTALLKKKKSKIPMKQQNVVLIKTNI